MKIVEETSQRLHVRHVPWFLRGLFIMFALVGLIGGPFSAELDSLLERVFVFSLGLGALALGWWATPTLDLVLDRTAGTVTLREARLVGASERTLPFGRVRARQQAQHDDGGRLVRLALEVDDEVLPLEKGYGSVNRDGIEAEINRWLEGRPPPQRPAVARA